MKVKMITILALMMLASTAAWADFTLSATPVEGGSSLRFGKVVESEESVREVRLRVNSVTGARYQLRQRLLDPLVDEKGARLNSDAISFYTLRGSNTRGSLYQDMISSLDSSERVIYTSDPAGDTDSLIIAYKVSGKMLNANGNFFGRIAYTLIPQGAGSQQQVFLNIYIDAQGGLDVKVEAPASGNSLRLVSGEKSNPCELGLNMTGLSGAQYVVKQSVQDGLRNEAGDILADGVVKYLVTAQNGVSEVVSLAGLSNRSEKIYSTSDGVASDAVVVKFVLDNDAANKLDAGTYRGQLLYSIEANGVLVKTVTVDAVVEIKPVFQLQLISDTRAEVMFRDVKPNETVEPKKAVIRVITNTKRPYCVVQKISGPLTNAAGDTIPAENFVLKLTLAPESTGRVAFTEDTPVKVGDTQIFSSDAVGTPAEFQLEYTILPLRKAKEGNYYFNMSFALMEK